MILYFFKKGIAKRLLLALVLCLVFALSVVVAMGAQTTRKGIVTTDPGYNLNIREDAGSSYPAVTKVMSGQTVTVLGEKKDSSGLLWYLVEYNGKTGYASSQYIELLPEETTKPPESTTAPGTSGETTGGQTPPSQPDMSDFEKYLTDQGFPESYKQSLRDLHELYPNWIFKAQHVDIDFYGAVAEQQKEARSLVWSGSISSWKSIEGDAYDWKTNTWKGFDGANWVKASKEIIAYYMDPRNFLGVNSVFQFLEQSFDENIQTIDGVKQIIAGTFMENDVVDQDGSNLNYATAIYNAGKEYGANPYVLAAMLVQEQGVNGTSGLISGRYPGYEGYYNYFNIGAYEQGNMSAVERGLWYARGGNATDTSNLSNLRPWTSRLKAINGGAYYYASGYISVGQNTLYLKRFNAQGNAPFTHQYMTNIQGAASEAGELAQGYSAELRVAALSFYIPVYKNMPENAIERPTGDGSPNMKLSSLSVGDYQLTPEFDPDVLEYMLVVPPSVSSIKINASAMEGSATITGAGEKGIASGEQTFEIKVTAGNGNERVYKITVAKENSESFGKVTFSDKYKFKDDTVYRIAPGTTVAQLRKALMIDGTITVTNVDGYKKLDDETIASNDKIGVYSSNNMPYGEYRAGVLGDVICDGNIIITDILRVRNIILGAWDTKALEILCADIDGNGEVGINDLIKIRNYILGTGTIS